VLYRENPEKSAEMRCALAAISGRRPGSGLEFF